MPHDKTCKGWKDIAAFLWTSERSAIRRVKELGLPAQRVAGALFAFGLAAAVIPRQPMPSDLTALLVKARVGAPVSAWCRAEFQPGKGGAFAIAVTPTSEGGRYVAFQADGQTADLGAFEGKPDLACYTRDQAAKLGVSIGLSETIQGSLKPRWNTTVVCGFTDGTSATCWQYSQRDRRFVQVGHWVT